MKIDMNDICVRHCVNIVIDCFNRELVVLYDADIPEEKVYNILNERYFQWFDDEIAETDWCCEEFMLQGLKDRGIRFLPIYVDDSDDD